MDSARLTRVATINRQPIRFPLWAGLLVLSGLAPLFAGAEEAINDLSVRVADRLVTVIARDVPMHRVIEAIAEQAELRVVQHATLDHSVSLDIENRPLPDVLDAILRGESYQLFQSSHDIDEARVFDPVPGTLWIFSEGSLLAPAATVFFEAVLLHGSYSEKKEAIRELKRLATPEAVQALSLALQDYDPRIRDVALEALASIGSDAALGAIASASLDSNPWIRSEAAVAFSATDSESALQYLRLAMEDPDPRVRMSVVDAYAELPSDEAVTVISRALRDDDPEVRMHAVDALEEVGASVAFDALMRAREANNPNIQNAVDSSLHLVKQHEGSVDTTP